MPKRGQNGAVWVVGRDTDRCMLHLFLENRDADMYIREREST